MGKNSILIIEDEAIVASDLAERLEEAGYLVVSIASTGKQALNIIDKTPPDLVLMDIKIQGDMDGIDTAGAIHSKTNVPVVYLTAYSDESLLEKAKTTEPFGYLVKPVEDRQLFAIIEMTLHKAKMEANRAQRLKNTEELLAGMKKLNDILTLCSICRKIRNEEGHWEMIESYIQKHSNTEFSHGICPKCAAKYYPDMDLYGDDQI